MTTWDYIRDLFRPEDRIAICWKVHTASTFNQRFLRAMNAQGNNIYMAMNPIRPGSRSRTKQDIREVRRVYLDLDTHGDLTFNRILADPLLPRPNYALTTSPGKYQVIWNVKQFEPNDAEALMRGFSREYHADPAAVDISRVLRLPGLHNKKYDLTFQVTAQKFTSAVYTPGCFPVYQPASPSTASRRSPSTLVNTPSHRDWAYVCRELWKAADPAAEEARLIDELARRAQFRNKPKPRYYAELTVSKARGYIATKRDSSSGLK